MPVAPDDPRLQQCGFAKLVDEANDLVYVMRKYEIILGRQSKSAGTDVILGQENMNVSRAHAKIRWNFEARSFELLVMGKNGVTVRGALVTPASAPFPLQSQDVLQLGTFNLTFLLPRAPPRAPARPAAVMPAAAAEHRPLQQVVVQAQQPWNGQVAQHGHVGPAVGAQQVQQVQQAAAAGSRPGQGLPVPASQPLLQQPGAQPQQAAAQHAPPVPLQPLQQQPAAPALTPQMLAQMQSVYTQQLQSFGQQQQQQMMAQRMAMAQQQAGQQQQQQAQTHAVGAAGSLPQQQQQQQQPAAAAAAAMQHQAPAFPQYNQQQQQQH